MAFKKYTQCYVHTPGDKPFNESGLAGLALLYGVLPGVLFGALTGIAVGFLAGGPIGAFAGLFSGLTVGLTLALTKAADEWLMHRLVCVSGVQCAVGFVRRNPENSELGKFDNDQFFDLSPMPHPAGAFLGKDAKGDDKFEYDYSGPSDNYKSNLPGLIVGTDARNNIASHPKNDMLTDGEQGTKFIKPSIADLPYDTSRSWLHCEAEGDFWIRIRDLATALSALIALLAIATGVATYAGAAAGAAKGCAIGGFLGPIGCFFGAIVGGIIGGAAAGGAVGGGSYLLVKAILQAVFDTNPGNVEDANIGDAAFKPISENDRVAVVGEHVYDGFHEGWHEFHPLMSVVKLADKKAQGESDYYLQWNPAFLDSDPLPKDDLPGMPNDIKGITPDDMRVGLESDRFRRRVEWLKDRWCGLMSEAFDPAVGTMQQGLSNRWTIHPDVDGCVPG